MTRTIIQKNRVAVITGAAAGIGLAATKFLSEKGMKLVLFDINEDALKAVVETLPTEAVYLGGDVRDYSALEKLHQLTYETFGECALLFNNAGIGKKAGPLDAYSDWEETVAVNFSSIVNLQHLFVPTMLAQNNEGAVVNLGSKEGITTPPGNVAYSVSKGAVKILTEHLQHELRNIPDCQVSAHLLVPGYTWTPMNFPEADFERPETKPEAPWSAEELLEYFYKRFEQGDFYIIALDNEVTKVIDDRRMRWAMDDLIYNRPALSRWDKDYQEAFSSWQNKGPLA
ncbi:SDR family NAD(P)-dependent oxidoreductase [Streptococcus sp. H31]|uniref:SDR family NAD(P)-dependent oxidoreductase n=1 Tax=Streptococcus huangxiaojuni TaxID=3237239 RepID=UPI0034A5427A